jgi:hypothetical protein
MKNVHENTNAILPTARLLMSSVCLYLCICILYIYLFLALCQ